MWGTNLQGNYSSDEDGYITSEAINLSSLSGAPSIDLRWWSYLDSESGYDFASVEVSANDNDGPWVRVWGLTSGNAAAWQAISVSLPTADYAVPSFRMRFRFTSDLANNYMGWYVDDISVQAGSPDSCDPGEDNPNPDGGTVPPPPYVPGSGGVGGGTGGPGGSTTAVGGSTGGGGIGGSTSCSQCVWEHTFESNDGGFTVSGSLPSWQVGVPAGTGGNPGPSAAHA